MCIHISRVVQERAQLKAGIYQACGQAVETFTALRDSMEEEAIISPVYYYYFKCRIMNLLGKREDKQRVNDMGRCIGRGGSVNLVNEWPERAMQGEIKWKTQKKGVVHLQPLLFSL